MERVDERGVPIIITGSAGVGKGTVLAELMKKDGRYKMSVSATTRQPRPGEVDGVNYYFITREEFEDFIEKGSMVEYAEYIGNLYGSPKEFAEKSINEGCRLIFEIETEGAFNVKKIFPEALMIFILAPTYAELEKRLVERKTETEEKIRERLEKSKKEILSLGSFDYFVINETGRAEESAENIHRIINLELKRRENSVNGEESAFLESFSASPDRIERFMEGYY